MADFSPPLAKWPIGFIDPNQPNLVLPDLQFLKYQQLLFNQITNAQGTVTSVGLVLPGIFSVSGSPVTAAGTLTGTLANQTANLVWAGPTSGGAAAPAFRALVNADMPSSGTGSGTVTSVAGNFTGGLITVGGSPITSSGTLALTVAGTSGGVPYFSSASTWASSALLTANAIMLGGGAGAAPATLGSLGTTTTVLHGNAAGAPTFGAVSLSADVSGNLGVAHLNSGTSASNLTYWRGDGQWATPSGGGNASFGTASGNTAGDIVVMADTNTGVADSGTAAVTAKAPQLWQTARNAIYYTAAGNIVTIASGGQMAGLGTSWKLTPSFSGRLKFIATFNIYQEAVGASANAQIYYGTGTAPAANAAITGTAVAQPLNAVVAGNTYVTPYSLYGEVTGLTPATAYWFDLAINSSGTVVLQSVTLLGEEF